ncbi:D-2-hydroxyacid dehydrogenase [Rhodovarius crocodyli]|uniref:D-2-hydroxyacid dehydrogenase n=2 Tax=Rhodovarius crocodyli TaxID=1979269 RepID=A0A437MPX0_9PROT|nr:D-2-hydroxyacid dehydrogenase [Rhodovarius crocodyli]
MGMLPPRDKITIGFAHVAYNCKARLDARNLGFRTLEARTRAELDAMLPELDVLSLSGMWRNDIPPLAPKLRYVQSMSAGTDQYDRAIMKAAGISLASAAGANAKAVSEHAISLMLAMTRRLPEARDNQHKKFWRGMQSDFWTREDELAGKTLIVVGMGRIGGRLIRLAKAFEMHVIGVRANPAAGAEGADEVFGMDALPAILPRADMVVLVCPLTPETTGLMNATTLAAMKPSAYLINCARGKVCDEAELIAALVSGKIKGAALDVTATEPLPETSPLWTLPNVFITPHTGGETCVYEDNVLDLLVANLERVWAGESTLINQIV